MTLQLLLKSSDTVSGYFKLPIDSANNDFGFSSRKKSNFSSFQLMNLTIMTWFQFSLTPKKTYLRMFHPSLYHTYTFLFMGIHMKFFELSLSLTLFSVWQTLVKVSCCMVRILLKLLPELILAEL